MNKIKKIIIIMALSTLLINPNEYRITHTNDDLIKKEYKNEIIKTSNLIFDTATENSIIL